MNDVSKTSLSALGETLAAEYLTRIGYQVILRNYHAPYGEIDLIASYREELIFIEVKTRNSHNLQAAENSITRSKQQKITQTAMHFISNFPQYADLSCRFDVLLVFRYSIDDTYKVIHYPNAYNPIFKQNQG